MIQFDPSRCLEPAGPKATPGARCVYLPIVQERRYYPALATLAAKPDSGAMLRAANFLKIETRTRLVWTIDCGVQAEPHPHLERVLRLNCWRGRANFVWHDDGSEVRCEHRTRIRRKSQTIICRPQTQPKSPNTLLDPSLAILRHH